MKAKKAKKLIEDHVDRGIETSASNLILSKVSQVLKESGFKEPFSLNKIAYVPETEEFRDNGDEDGLEVDPTGLGKKKRKNLKNQ